MADKCIMAIGGHVGDAELTCGGTLATYALRGYKIVTVGATGGERGNPPHLTPAEYREQKLLEAKAFAERLGGEAVVLPYRDGELECSEESKLLLCDIIRKYRPEKLLTHWKNSMHRDHIICSELVRQAQFLAGLKSFERPLPASYAPGPFMAENWEDADGFVPHTYFEVTKEGFELWKEAIDTHWFAVNSRDFRYKEYYCALKRVRGLEGRFEYAEAFALSEYQKRVKIPAPKEQ